MKSPFQLSCDKKFFFVSGLFCETNNIEKMKLFSSISWFRFRFFVRISISRCVSVSSQPHFVFMLSPKRTNFAFFSHIIMEKWKICDFRKSDEGSLAQAFICHVMLQLEHSLLKMLIMHKKVILGTLQSLLTNIIIITSINRNWKLQNPSCRHCKL